ncbi:MAG TPA: ABC transporter substrate-binding protein, partial [Alcaligenes faecalis]|nr:ABC transporter substrate-binding protein [Alcaligenes faecalis]
MKLIRSVHQVAAALACVGLMSGAAVHAQSVSVSSIVEHPA